MNSLPNPEFDALVTGLQESLRDPAINDVLEHIQQFEDHLNNGTGGADDESITHAVSTMDMVLSSRNLMGEGILVTGKLRIDEDEYSGRDDNRDDHWRVLFGEVHHDNYGAYFEVNQLDLEALGFDYQMIEDENGITYRLALLVASELEEENDLTSLYVYPNELFDIAPREHSLAYMLREIREHYPEIAEQLDTLPENCKDDQKIFESLQGFEVEIDWSKHPGLTDDERDEVVRFVEAYIETRVQFDTAMYEFVVTGPYGKTGPGDTEIHQEAIEPMIKRGFFHGIGLRQMSASEEDDQYKSYAPELAIIASSSRRGAGNELIFLPAYSIDEIKNLRNPEIECEEDGYEYIPEQPDYYLSRPEDSDYEEYYSETDTENDSADEDRYGDERLSEVVVNREDELLYLKAKIREFTTMAEQMRASVFTSDEALGEAQQILTNKFLELYQIYSDTKTAVEVSGPSVRSIDGSIVFSFNSDEASASMTVSNIDPKNADLLTFEKGAIAGFVTKAEFLADGSKQILPLLRFQSQDSVGPVPLSRDTQYDLNYAEAYVTKYFYAVLDGDVTIELPEYERMMNVRDQLVQINRRFPEHGVLAESLEKLHAIMKQADPQIFEDFPDIELIRSIGEIAGTSEDLGDRVSTALLDILVNASVYVDSKAYDEEGTVYSQIKLNAVIADIVPKVGFIPEKAPLLKIHVPTKTLPIEIVETLEKDAEYAVYYVPITSLNALKI